MVAISENWAQLLEPGLRQIFFLQYEALAAESKTPLLFNVMASQRYNEVFLNVGGMGNWNEYTGAIEYDDMEQGFTTTLTHKEYSKGFAVERKLVDDDLYNIINARPQQLALSAARTREEHAASVFINAFTAGYAGGDGVALCSASHPYSPSNAGVQSNAGSLALTYDNLVTVRRTMREFEDDRGKLMPINPDILLVPPELEETAFSIVKTANKPDIADYHANFVGSQFRAIVWDYLTDANAWFVLDSRLAKQYLLWIDRVPLEFALDPASNYNLVARYRGYMRYSFGWVDWRWVYGNNPS